MNINKRLFLWGIVVAMGINLGVLKVGAQTPPTALSVSNQVVTQGATAQFEVTVAGGGPFTYQWFYNGMPVFLNNYIETVAGCTNLVARYWGDGGSATTAGLWYPSGVTVDAFGNFYIADRGNNVIRKVDTNNVISTVAGNFMRGATYSGDGGAATNAGLNFPSDVVVDGIGDIYIADTYNNVVRRVDAAGIITTVAGNFTLGGAYSGDGGAAIDAALYHPFGLALDNLGNLYIAENGNNVIRKVDSKSIITTIVGDFNLGGTYLGDGGTATNAGLWMPNAVAVDNGGNIYIADNGNQVIRKVDDKNLISTIAGNYSLGGGYSGDGGLATNAALNAENGVAIDGWGNIFIADTMNNVVRQVDENGVITTVAGNFILKKRFIREVCT